MAAGVAMLWLVLVPTAEPSDGVKSGVRDGIEYLNGALGNQARHLAGLKKERLVSQTDSPPQ